MSKRRHASKESRTPPPPAASTTAQSEPPVAVDVIDAIPDRSDRPRLWKYLVPAAIFVAWIAFLVYCQIAGAPPKVK